MKLILSESQRSELAKLGTETHFMLIDSRNPPIAYIHKRDKTGRRIGQIQFDYKTFNFFDFIGAIRYVREIYPDFYKYRINRNYVKTLLDSGEIKCLS
jgi:hypothetical protein